MKKYGVLALMLVMALLPAAVRAQGDNPVTLSGGYAIALPVGWQQAESEGIYTFTQGDLAIALTLPDVLASRFNLSADMDAAAVLAEYHAATLGETIDPAVDVQMYLSEQRAMATHNFETNDGAMLGVTVVLEVLPGKFALMEFQAPADVYGGTLPDAYRIMGTLQGSKPAAGVSTASCQVQAANASAQLRVGPGTNRGIYSGLKTDTAYGVLGKKTVADGSLWWRLDMDTGSANELWVADADVQTTGSCDQVADVDAPPVIFGRPRAPAPTPVPTSGEQPAGEQPWPRNPPPIRRRSRRTVPGLCYWPPISRQAAREAPTERYTFAELGLVESRVGHCSDYRLSGWQHADNGWARILRYRWLLPVRGNR